jgi:cardiolipin synthase
VKNLDFGITKNNKVELLKDGPDYDSLYLELIKNAKSCIHLQVYIFDLDEFGNQVFNELVKACERGVTVYILVDAVGSDDLEDEKIDELRNAGAYFCKFNGISFKRLLRWGRRLHHKVLLVDQEKAVVGGINIVSPYVDHKFKNPRLDFAVYLEGPITRDLKNYCEELFLKNYGHLTFEPDRIPSTFEGGFDAQVSVNDWIERRLSISRNYMDLVENAEERITILNSYFFPRPKWIKKLTDAAKRGVKVKLILPKFSDWPSWILATEFIYSYFIENGVEIYLWNKSVLHGKIACVDRKWATIGSFNLNYTSYQGNLEMNIDVTSNEFAGNMDKEIEKLIEEGCEKIDLKQSKNFFSKAKRFFFYALLSVIQNFSLAFVFQEDEANHDVQKVRTVAHLVVAMGCILFGLIGLVVPGIVGIPFLFFGIFLLSRLVILNKKRDL